MTDRGILKVKVVGYISTNCYIYMDSKSREMFIVDPGDEGAAVAKLCEEMGGTPKAVLLTHGHFDHIGGVNAFLKAYPNVRIYAGKREAGMLENSDYNRLVGFPDYTVSPTDYVSDNDVITVAGCELKVLETPGHTAGSVCFYDEAEHLLYAGDTMFYESYGRTDFPTGSSADIFESIKKLVTLPADVDVLPGHGPMTTIAHEKDCNPGLWN